MTANVIVNTGGGVPVSEVAADFSGDGKQDLAVTNTGCNTCGLTILRGNGDGTFQAPLFTANLGGPYYVASGDFNGDGKQDLAVIGFVPTNLNTAAVFILLGNGDGTFTLKTTLTGISNPQSLTLGDFNGDGKLDMAVVDRTTNSVSVFLGNGDGTMQAPINTSGLGIGAATYVAAADFNKDNKLDLVLSDQSNSQVVVLLGNGDGHFQAARSIALNSGGGFDVAVGDFNGDGLPDIVASSPIAQAVIILLGKGDGSFQPAISYSAGQLGGGATNLAVGDFNKDGKLDILTSINGSLGLGSSVSLLLGKGDGTLLPASLVTVDQLSGQLAVADFNGDGNPDWIAGNTQGHVLTMALGNGDGTFRAGANYALGNGPFVALADFNKDGKLDVVAVDRSSNDVRVLLGKGDGTFQPGIITPVSGAFSGIATGDFNNDGNQDVVVSDSTGAAPRNVIVLLGNGDGTFAAPARFTSGGSGEGLILTEDFNGDGKLDIAVVNQSDNTVSILLGNGDGTFQAPKITPTLATDGFLGAMAAGDLNGDGKLDLVVPDYVGSASGQVAILLGKGDGTFQAPTFITSHAGSTWPVIADFNKDGNLDLAVANQFGTIDVFLGNGDGTFNTSLVLNDVQPNIGSPIPIALAVGDFNLDNNLDLLVGTDISDNTQARNPSGLPAGMQLYLGNGDGTFAAPQDYLTGAQSFPVLVGDFNADGAPDVAAGDLGENIVSILLNQTPPPINVTPVSLAFADQLVGTTSATRAITITNNGAAATTITIAASGDFTQTNTCPVSPATLAVAANCTVNVAFQPKATGLRNGAITVTHKLAGSPQSVALSGSGVAPIATLDKTSIPFGNQPVGTSSPVQTVNLSNTGTATLTITNIAITGANSGDFSQTNACGASVATGSNCSIMVTFKPTTTNTRTGSVSITDNAAGSPQIVALSGTGVQPAVTLSSASLSLGNQLITTTSAPQGVTLTNTGTAAVTISSIALSGTNSGDFAQTDTCPVNNSNLAVGAKCTINVTFTPTASGNRAASITITDNTSGSPQSVSLTGTGTDFSLAAAAGANCPAAGNCTTSSIISAGQTATYDLQISPVSGFSGTVALTCSGAPTPSTCAVSPTSAPPNGSSSYAFTVTVNNTANALMLPLLEPPSVPQLPIRFGIPLVCVLVLMFLPAWVGIYRRQTKRLAIPALALLILSLSYLSGCGGGGGGGPIVKPPTNATITVQGTSGGVNRTLPLSLTINH
ncbi:MAG TPA: FG-GAP-like repeat-containing protein [Candidatus Acidoferrum sp.]|nr:FG-GAP-like repeat-containing protein [Candidatus Acidoferrum sp.]